MLILIRRQAECLRDHVDRWHNKLCSPHTVMNSAGRLVSASVPQNQLTYAYSANNSCGANVGAGKDGDRTKLTDSLNGATATQQSYCYDNADLLTSTTETAPPSGADALLSTNLSSTGATPNLVYDAHENTTKIANESIVYDETNRHVSTTVTGGASIVYQRDSRNRIVSVTTTPAGGSATTIRYAYSGSNDVPTFTLSSANVLMEQMVTLAGGVSVSFRSGSQVWAYPDLHGDVVVTADSSGKRVGTLSIYDPFGDALDPASGKIGTAIAKCERSSRHPRARNELRLGREQSGRIPKHRRNCNYRDG